MKKREREKKGAWYYMPLGLTPNYIQIFTWANEKTVRTKISG